MKNKILNNIIFILLAVLIILINGTFISVLNASTSKSPGKIIIIDPGHGGMDGGAVSKNGTIEKDINLAISKKLMGYLEDSGDTCIMIREVDEGLYSSHGRIRDKKNEDLRTRKEIIKKENADIFLSIHLNSFPQSQYYGAQVFYPIKSEESKLLAKCVQEELIKILNGGNKRVEKESNDYYILRDNNIPSIIVECGFLSNPNEEALLKDEKYQSKIAYAIYSGIEKYFEASTSK